MEKDLDQVEIEFNNGAKECFFSLYSQFQNAIRPLDRRRDDNVFQQLQGKYVYTLKQQLDDLAKTLIDKYHSIDNINQLKKELTGAISQYSNEFLQKSRSL